MKSTTSLFEPPLEPSQTILQNLKNLDQYLGQFNQSQQSAYFEQLVAESLSHVLYLPFYLKSNEDVSVPYRVTWQGNLNPVIKATKGQPDAIACCYNFHLIIEATKNVSSNQWVREFASSIRHCDNFCSGTGSRKQDVIVLLICRELHVDTYRSIKSNPRQEFKLIPIEVSELIRVLETSVLAFTLKHIEFRRLLYQLSDCIKKSTSLKDYRDCNANLIADWQQFILRAEMSAFLGVKSYEAIRQIGRKSVSSGEIFETLLTNQQVKEYFEIIRDTLQIRYIEDSLVIQSLGIVIGKLTVGKEEDESLFEPVPIKDFNTRGKRLINAVEKINGQFP